LQLKLPRYIEVNGELPVRGKFQLRNCRAPAREVVVPGLPSFRSDFGRRGRLGDPMSQNTRLQIPRAPGWISELFTRGELPGGATSLAASR
jgi:hypothetical protein